MRISKIELANYRCFDSAEFELGKFTLLMGANSSGKTSVISALLTALQSDRFPLYLSLNGELVETGDFREISRNHSTASGISIGLTFTDSKGESVRKYRATYGLNRATRMPILDDAQISGDGYKWVIKKSRGSKYSLSWTADAAGKQKKEMQKALPGVFQALEKSFYAVPFKNSKGAKKLSKEAKKVKPISGQSGTTERALKELGKYHEGDDFWSLSGLSRALGFVPGFQQEFCYLGSQRSAPQRTYYHSVGPNLKIGIAGQNTVEQILLWKTNGAPELLQLTKNAKALGVATNIRAAKLAGGRVEIRIRTKGSSVTSSLSDVGFGVNQLLPILVAELQHPSGSTLAISQPETHLHPSVQAQLATHFVAMANSKSIRYVIETHSEYMINRFRRLIAAGKLDSKDVTAFHIEQTGGGAKVHRVHFEKDGRITGAPKDFFETYSSDVLGIALKD